MEQVNIKDNSYIHNSGYLSFTKCKQCGRKFIKHYEWAYKIATTRGYKYFCSWSCLQKFRNIRGTNER